jgi:hypothetical protein
VLRIASSSARRGADSRGGRSAQRAAHEIARDCTRVSPDEDRPYGALRPSPRIATCGIGGQHGLSEQHLDPVLRTVVAQRDERFRREHGSVEDDPGDTATDSLWILE